MSARAIVVPPHSVTKVVRDPNVTSVRIRVTLNHVDNTLFDSVHAKRYAGIGPLQQNQEKSRGAGRTRQFLRSVSKRLTAESLIEAC